MSCLVCKNITIIIQHILKDHQFRIHCGTSTRCLQDSATFLLLLGHADQLLLQLQLQHPQLLGGLLSEPVSAGGGVGVVGPALGTLLQAEVAGGADLVHLLTCVDGSNSSHLTHGTRQQSSLLDNLLLEEGNKLWTVIIIFNFNPFAKLLVAGSLSLHWVHAGVKHCSDWKIEDLLTSLAILAINYEKVRGCKI